MEMMVHCPACHARITVPEKAAGHSVRCPACKKPFKVPAQQEIVEDTIACWLEMETEQATELEKKKTEEMLSLSPIDELTEYIPPTESLGTDASDSGELAVSSAAPSASKSAKSTSKAATSKSTPVVPTSINPIELDDI